MAEVCEAISHGSLMGARGNSGVILSQILRGLADTFAPLDDGRRAPTSPPACGARADAAYEAVLRPVEGTILTVVRGGGRGGRAGGRPRARPRSPRCSSAAARRGARRGRAHARPAAGAARGRRRRRRRTRLRAAARRVPPRRRRARRCPSRRGRSHADVAVAAHAPATAHAARRRRRPALRGHVLPRRRRRRASPRSSRRGARSATRSSSSAATASGTATCTPTTSAPRSRPASTSGRPREHPGHRPARAGREREEEAWVATAARRRPRHAARARSTTAVVAVAVGDGAAHALLASLGVQQVVAGGQSMNPSTAQILEAVERVRRRRRDRPAEQQEHRAGRRSRSPELTEQAGRRWCRPRRWSRRSPRWSRTTPTPSLDDNARRDGGGRRRACAPARSPRRCATASPSAARSPPATGSRSRATASAWRPKSAADAAIALLDALVDDDGEIVTIIVGADADAGDTARISEHVARRASRRRGRGARRWPAALPVPRRRRVARRRGRARCAAGLTLRELAAHRVTELEGGRRQAARRAWRRWASTTVLDLLEHYPRRYVDRTERAEIARARRSARRRRSTPRCAPIHARRTRDRKRTIVERDRLRRHRPARARVLQPAVARAAAAAGHAGVAVRQGRAATGASAR